MTEARWPIHWIGDLTLDHLQLLASEPSGMLKDPLAFAQRLEEIEEEDRRWLGQSAR